MGVDNELYTTNQIKNDVVKESSLIDLWNRITPINSTRIGDTTVVNGKEVMNENKTFNTKPIEELSKQYADTKYETQDESAPYFYELENVDTGVKKYGIAPKGLEHRYAGQNMSQWKINYNKRRTDAVDLESLIHGNESMLKQSQVDLGLAKNTQIGKGASEIYTEGLSKVDAILSPEQKALTTKLVGAMPNINIAKPTTTENQSVINQLFGETLSSNLAQTNSDIRTDKKPTDMLSLGDYIPKEQITNEANLYTNQEFMNKSKNVLNAFGVDIAGKSDKEVADIILKEQSKYGFNLADMIYKTTQFADKDSQVSKDWLDLERMKDKTDLSMRQIGDATKAMLTDPFNLVALETMGLGLVPKAIAQAGAKKALETQIAKTAMIGGLEGAGFNTADNLLRQKLGILSGEQQSYNPEKAWESTATGTAVGGALGGAVGKLFGGNEQEAINNELTKNFLANRTNDEKAIEQNIEQNIEQQQEQENSNKVFDLKKDVELNKINAKQNIETKQKEVITEPEVLTKEQYYSEQEPKLRENKKGKLYTKSGTEIDSKEVKASKKAVEDIEFDVSSPVAERKPIEGNEYIPETNNPRKFKLKYDDVGRVYTEDANLLSFQGTADQKASLKQRVKEGIDNADSEVNRRLEFYDRDEKLKERYGRTEASFDEKVEIPKSKAEADRLRFQIDQYKDIRDNQNLATKVRREAKQRLNDLYQNKISLPRPPEDLATKAEQKFIESNQVERIADVNIRDKDLKEEFEAFKKTIRNKEGYEYKPAQTIEQVFTNTIKNAKASKADVIKSIQKIKQKETLLGNKDFTVSKITPEVKAKYRDDITKIENYTGALEDVIAYQKGLLQPDEFMFRARRRIDDEVANAGGSFKSEEELNTFIDDIIKKYEETGTRVDKESIKKEFAKEFKSGEQNLEKKKLREENEKLSASKKHDALVKNLKYYKDFKRVPRYKAGQQAGKQALNSSQMKDIDDGILSLKEIADKTSPVSTNTERKDAIKKARELASKKVNTTRAKNLGIKDRYKLPESIVFKDTVKDASNSVAQIITVLLGSKRLASVSKLLGTNDDVRSIIGKQMELNGMSLPKYPKDITWKDVVKPLFMTENYGQMEKGLIENLMKTHKISKDEAKMYYDAYAKASDDIVPEMVEFKKAIYDTYYKTGKANLSWELPDGFKVNINLSKDRDGSIRIRDNNLKINIKTDDFDNFSRAIMPRLIHSVDAYVARTMNKAGFPTVHDAFVIPKGKEQLAEDTYTKIMSDLNDSDLLHKMMKSIGYEGKPLKDGTLTKEDIEGSKYKLGTEHESGVSESSKLRSMELNKQLTNEGVMKDYMASGNYRQIPTNRLVDALVNEAGYNNSIISVAREGDDAFERQVALAFQSPEYNSKLALKAPKDVDKAMWNKAQEEIFNEARAKLEYHPWLTDAVQGERKWFTKEGKIVGQYNKTYAEIYEDLYQEFIKQHNTIAQTKVIQSDKPLDKVNFRFNKNSKFTTTINGITNKETFVKNVDNIAGKSKTEMLTLGEAIVKSKIDEAKSNIVKSKWQNFKNLWKEQVDVEGKYKEFNLLQKMRNIYKSEVDRDAELLYVDLKKIPEDKRNDIMLLLKSDYEAIDGMTKKEADEFFKENNELYNIAKRAIDQTAKGVSSQSEQYGAYKNNAHLVATMYDLPKNVEQTIDKLISIKAMEDNKAWDALDKYTPKDKDVRFVLDTMKQKRMVSEGELFVDSPEKIVKGYFSEVYRGNKKIDENGKVRYDADSRYESGILGTERENNKVGTKVNLKDYLKEYNQIEDIYVNYFDPKGFNLDKLLPKQQKAFEKLNMKYYLDEKMTARQERYLGDLIKLGFDFEDSLEGLNKKLDFMTKHRLKEGHDGFRKVTGEDIRIEAGKSQDLADILTETVRATNEKVKERGIVEKVLSDLAKEDSILFSVKPKDGMVELTEEQLAKLPYSLRAEIKYIDRDLVDKLVGRDEVRIYNGNNEHLKIADRLLNNLGTMFKQNVVLKNPTSYINAFLVNHTIGASAGLTPKQMYRYQKQALADIKEMQDLLERLSRQKVTGKKLDEILFAKLKNNQLYQLEKIGGLSTNRVDGVVGDNDLLGSILEDHMPSAIFKMARNLNLNQNTVVGKHTLRTFSKIDTMGRYMIAKKYMDDGMDIKSASDKANSLFGDMDTMVPPSIELLDKYGLAPFLKWFTLTHPGLFKLTKENPKKVLAVAIGIYVFGQETDTNLASVNPIEGALDFADSTLQFSTIEKLEKDGLLDTVLNRARSNVIPRYLYNAYRSPETLGTKYYLKKRMEKPKSDKQVDYRGFTQQMVEGD